MKNFRESKEYPGSVEGTVKFDKETACALMHGFAKNPDTVEQLKGIVEEEKLKLFGEILLNTEEMKFVPSEVMKTIYTQIAKQELKRLENETNMLCGHSVQEHRQALEAVLEKMQTKVH